MQLYRYLALGMAVVATAVPQRYSGVLKDSLNVKPKIAHQI